MDNKELPFPEAGKSPKGKKRQIFKGIIFILLGVLCLALGIYLLRFC